MMKWFTKKRLAQLLYILILISAANEFIPGGGLRLSYNYSTYDIKSNDVVTSDNETPSFATAPPCSLLPDGDIPCILQVPLKLRDELCEGDACIMLAITFYKSEYSWLKYLPLIKPMIGKIGVKAEWSMPAPRGEYEYLTGAFSGVMEIKGVELGISSATNSEHSILKQQINRLKGVVRKRVSKQIKSLP